MHQHQIVAQIMLILSILNAVLAAPPLSVREIPGEHGVVAVRVPAEGVVAVLEKRPFEPEWEISAGPSLEHPEPQSTNPPEPEEMNSPGPTPPPPRKKTSTRPKIMTPEKIKATKIIMGMGFFTAAVLGLVDIHIMFHNSNSSAS